MTICLSLYLDITTNKAQDPKASAQIKSALILAALNIHGRTKIIENIPTRDHTERL